MEKVHSLFPLALMRGSLVKIIIRREEEAEEGGGGGMAYRKLAAMLRALEKISKHMCMYASYVRSCTSICLTLHMLYTIQLRVQMVYC